MERAIEAYAARFHEERPAKPGRCQRCGHRGPLHWHGHYVRRLITRTKIHALPIRRLFCTLCRRTFALLPPFVVKFCHYAKEVIDTALAWLKSRTYHSVAESIANGLVEQEHRGLATLTLYFWQRRFA